MSSPGIQAVLHKASSELDEQIQDKLRSRDKDMDQFMQTVRRKVKYTDARSVFKTADNQQGPACNHRGPNGVPYTGPICEICFCHIGSDPVEAQSSPDNYKDVGIPPGMLRSPLSYIGTENWVKETISKSYGNSMDRNHCQFDNQEEASSASVGSRIFPADPSDYASQSSSYNPVIFVPAAPDLTASADTVAQLNDAGPRLSEYFFGGEENHYPGTGRSTHGRRVMLFDEQPKKIKSVGKNGTVTKFFKNLFKK